MGKRAAIVFIWIAAVGAAMSVDACGRSAFEDQGDSGVVEDARGPTTDATADALGDSAPFGDVLYVSAATGNDANNGSTPTTAKKTIGASLATASGGHFAVHVCKGTYAEKNLAVTFPLALTGGYDCTTWQRTQYYGGPSFDAVNETVITNASPGTQSETLVVRGSVIDRTTLIDGFTIVGAPSSLTALPAAVFVDQGAKPVLSNDKMQGATLGSTDSGPAPGLIIDGDSAPDIGYDLILGGAGNEYGYPVSVGLFVQSGAPHIHHNKIRGGGGSCGTPCEPSYGAVLYGNGEMTAAAGNPIEFNDIAGGPNSGEARGLLVQTSANADILDNNIRGSDGAPARSMMALQCYAPHARILRNRITGGPITASAAESWGLLLVGSNFVVANNMIHGGDTTMNLTNPVQLYLGANGVLAYNTIYQGYIPTTNTSPVAQLELTAFNESRDLFVMNNIFAGANNTDTAFFTFDAISQVALFSNNVFVDEGFALGANENCGSAWATCPFYATVSALESAINSPADAGAHGSASGNVLLPNSCPDARCTTDVQNLLVSFGAPPDDGISALEGPGWFLRTPPPCSVARGAMPIVDFDLDVADAGDAGAGDAGVSLTITDDFFHQTRSATTPSVGAGEFTGACTP